MQGKCVCAYYNNNRCLCYGKKPCKIGDCWRFLKNYKTTAKSHFTKTIFVM